MSQCHCCGKTSPLISKALHYCLDCIRSEFDKIRSSIESIHQESRIPFHLPEKAPHNTEGVLCPFCTNNCQMIPDEKGYCGLRQNKGGRLVHLAGTKDKGLVQWYHDPLPTNCVADWVCPGGTGAGYPKYAYKKGPEYGYTNLAVFYEACTFNCLYCQNYHFRNSSVTSVKKSAAQLSDTVDNSTTCICYFGGDPTPQLPHAITASRRVIQQHPDRILRICWETNGSMNRHLLKKMLDLSLHSGGCIKFDLKAFDSRLHLALCGVSNSQTLDNFKWLGQFITERPEPPLLIASTLLVSGYIDKEEVGKIARFIASINPTIPYSLLGFYPYFLMNDLPTTSRDQAEACQKVAIEAGLQRVHIGNMHLLS